MTAGTRRNGISKFGLFKRNSQDGEQATQHPRLADADHYTGRHADPRGKTTRKRVGRVVPAAAVAAALVAGAAAYGLSPAAAIRRRRSSTAAHAPATRQRDQHGWLRRGNSAASARLIGPPRPRAARAARRRPGRRPAPAKAAPKRDGGAVRRPGDRGRRQAPRPRPPRPAAVRHRRASAAATTLSCNLSCGMLPDNVTAIVSFLLAHGYSDNAAAGIAGNMYQESKGNPESEGMGGGGLIGFTPLPAGYVTGNPADRPADAARGGADLQPEWAGYLPALNAAASPADAAYIYVTDFERAGIPAAQHPRGLRRGRRQRLRHLGACV